jgi:DNA polymerase III epsilon subunit-like protein
VELKQGSLEYMAIVRLIKEIAARLPGGKLPDDYVVFDTETNGVHIATAKILQYGFCVVIRRRVALILSQLVNRPNLVIPKEAADIHGITLEKLAQEGIPAREYVPAVADMMHRWVKEGMIVVGHNLHRFDIPLFEIESAEFGKPFKFTSDSIIDTGMLVKGSQLGMFMRERETLRSFYDRVSSVRSRVKWSLDKHCYATYGLGSSGVRLDDAHDAAADCRLTHWLLETLRKEAGV